MSVSDLIGLRPGSCFQPVDRRYQLARLLALGELPEFAVDWCDDLTQRAAVHLRDGGPPDAILAAAFAIYGGPALDRGELEARLLAEQTSAEVDQAMGLPEGVVNGVHGLILRHFRPMGRQVVAVTCSDWPKGVRWPAGR